MSARILFILIYLVNPVVALIYLLKTTGFKYFVYTSSLFMAYFGMTTYFYGDNQRYRDRFFEICDASNGLEVALDSLDTFYGGIDFFIPMISWLVSLFTRDINVLFAIFGSLYGFFFAKNVKSVLGLLPKQKFSIFIGILFANYFLIYPFWTGTNAVRFVIGANVFVYFGFIYLKKYSFKTILLILFSTFFHFAFIFPFLIVLVFHFIRKTITLKMLPVILIVSFILSSPEIIPLGNILRGTEIDFFADKIASYSSLEYLGNRRDIVESKNWYAVYDKVLFKLSIGALLLATLLRMNKKIEFTQDLSMIKFSVLLFSIGNISSILPDGQRFVVLSYFFVIPQIIIHNLTGRFTWLQALVMCPLLLNIIVAARSGLDFLTLGTFISNPILAFSDFYEDTFLTRLIK